MEQTQRDHGVSCNETKGAFGIGILLVLLLMQGCRVGTVPSATQSGCKAVKHYNAEYWFHSYLQGLYCAQSGQWRSAEAEFRKSVQHPFKRDHEDRWRKKHRSSIYVSDFSHRELGITLFQSRRYQEAAASLERSHQFHLTPTAKARHYLKQTYEAWGARNPDDRWPPRLLHLPESGLSNRWTMRFSGVLEDDFYAKAVFVNGKLVTGDRIHASLPFQWHAEIAEGPNEFTFVGEDVTGKTVQKVLTITGDHRGPVVWVRGRTVTVTDTFGLASVRVNNRLQSVTQGAKVHSFTMPSGAEGSSVTLEATDQAGNVTQAPSLGQARASRFMVDMTPAHDQSTSKEEITLSGMVQSPALIQRIVVEGADFSHELPSGPGERVYFSHRIKLGLGANRITIRAYDTQGSKTVPLTITRIHSPLQKKGARWAVLPLWFINCQSQDPNKPEAWVSLHGVIDYAKTGCDSVESMHAQIQRALVHGDRFVMVGADKESVQKINFIRKGNEIGLSDSVVDRMVAGAKALPTGTMDVLSPLGEPQREAAQFNELGLFPLKVDALLVGIIRQEWEGLEVQLKIIPIEAPRSVMHIMQFGSRLGRGGLHRFATHFIQQIDREWPVIEGRVLEISAEKYRDGEIVREVHIDLAHQDGLKIGMEVILFPENLADDPALLSQLSDLPRAMVTNVGDRSSLATLSFEPGTSTLPVNPGGEWRVITR